MKMRVFIISLAVLYWVVASVSQSMMSPAATCAQKAEFAVRWTNDAPAPEEKALVQLARLSAEELGQEIPVATGNACKR